MNNYLISSSSFYEINEIVSNIIKDSSNIVTYDLEINQLKEVIEETFYLSFFNDTKYIIVNNANIFNTANASDEEYKMLKEYLDNPNPNVILIFTIQKPVSEKKVIVKLAREKMKVIIKTELSERENVNRLSKIFKDKNINISFMSINYIVNACQNNYDIICSEIEKIFIYLTDKLDITDEEVKLIVSFSESIDNFKLSDAVVKRNMNKALQSLRLLKENSIESFQLLGLIASQYRLIYLTKILTLENKNEFEIMQILQLKSPYPIKLAKENSYNYSESDLLNKISLLASLDLKSKSGLLDGYRALEMFILDL